MCTIYIIRHGQTDLNKKRVLQSRIDAPLNDEGIMQAEDAGERLRSEDISFDMIFSSPLKRAVQTARIIAGDDIPLQIDERLLEMDYGPYEGADLTSPPPELSHFFSDFVNNPAPEGMEPLARVVERAGQFLSKVIGKECRSIYLGHLSKENNYEALCYATVTTEITMGDNPYTGDDFPIEIAKRDRVSSMYRV